MIQTASKLFKYTLLTLASAASLGAVNLAHADTTLTDNYTLAQLVNDKAFKLVVGDKEFSNFDWHANGFFNDATGGLWESMDLAAHINVHGEITNSGNFGLDFTGPLQAHPGDSASAQLTYTVRVLDPNRYMSDFHLDGDPLVSGPNGQAVVREQQGEAAVGLAGGDAELPAVRRQRVEQRDDAVELVRVLDLVRVFRRRGALAERVRLLLRRREVLLRHRDARR